MKLEKNRRDKEDKEERRIKKRNEEGKKEKRREKIQGEDGKGKESVRVKMKSDWQTIVH